MILIPCTPDERGLAKRLMHSLPKEVRVCILEFEDRHDDLANDLQRPVRAFHGAMDRVGTGESMWVLVPDLVATDGVLPLLSLLKHADVALLPNFEANHPEALVDPSVVGFAATNVAFACFAWWAYACQTWEWDDDVLAPADYLLARIFDHVMRLGGIVAPICGEIPLSKVHAGEAPRAP